MGNNSNFVDFKVETQQPTAHTLKLTKKNQESDNNK